MKALTYEQMMLLYDREREAREAQVKAIETMIQSEREKSEARTAAIDKLSREIKEISRQLSNIGFSNGDAAEDFFFNSLEEKKELGNLHFDEIDRNVHRKKDRLEDEYDIFLKNGHSVAIIEVKYKVSSEHINTLTTRKVENFRKLFPQYAHHKVYTGIAGMSFAPKSEALAKESGVAVLKQKGDHLVVQAKTLRAF